MISYDGTTWSRRLPKTVGGHVGSHLSTTGHCGPADLVAEAAGGVEFPLKVSPHGRILPERAVRQDSRVIRELGVRALDGPDAHALADEVL